MKPPIIQLQRLVLHAVEPIEHLLRAAVVAHAVRSPVAEPDARPPALAGVGRHAHRTRVQPHRAVEVPDHALERARVVAQLVLDEGALHGRVAAQYLLVQLEDHLVPRQQLAREPPADDGHDGRPARGVEGDEGRLRQVAADVPAELGGAGGGPAEHLGAAHRVAHEEERRRGGDHGAQEVRDVGQHQRGRAREALLRRLVDGAAEAALVEAAHLDAGGCQRGEEVIVGIALMV